jgi:hypothetical protein
MNDKLLGMLIEYKDEFDRAPDNLSLGACTALVALYIHRLVGCGIDEPTAIGVLSEIYGLRDRRDSPGSAMTAKQLHMTVALARRAEPPKPQIPAAA